MKTMDKILKEARENTNNKANVSEDYSKEDYFRWFGEEVINLTKTEIGKFKKEVEK